jgi:hypothetical protein
MRLKEFLAESTSATSVNVKSFNLDSLIQCYKNAGYEVPANERKLFLASKYEKFTSNKQHAFIVMMKDDNEDKFYLTRFFVSIGAEGSLIAEPSGFLSFENDDRAVVQKKFDSGAK